MAFTNLTIPQTQFLEEFLRGTGRSLTEAQAEATYGIQNLRARMSELRAEGLRVRVDQTQDGRAKYSISARDVYGSRAKVFA
jgi:hypothetical protein